VPLRYGILDLLAVEPKSGYDLSRFAASTANVWPAQHSQIYPELTRLAAEGLITHTGQEGPRHRKTCQTTPAGIEALRSWLRDSQPDYSVRYEALLRVFCLRVLPTDEALAHVARDRAEYVRHLDYINTVLARRDWGADPTTRASRIAVEFGQRCYTMQIGWMDWAADQIRAGTLQPEGPLPAQATAAPARPSGPGLSSRPTRCGRCGISSAASSTRNDMIP
jgi:DNA-binding PadR family transcriptional regulator